MRMLSMPAQDVSFEHNDDSVADTTMHYNDENAIKITMKCSLCTTTPALQQTSNNNEEDDDNLTTA